MDRDTALLLATTLEEIGTALVSAGLALSPGTSAKPESALEAAAPAKPKRKRRTKAQIEADKKAEIEARIAAQASGPEPEPDTAAATEEERKRRTKAQIEADKKAEIEARIAAQSSKPEPEPDTAAAATEEEREPVTTTEEQRVTEFKALALPNLSYAGELLHLRGAKRFTEMTANQQEAVLEALRDQAARNG